MTLDAGTLPPPPPDPEDVEATTEITEALDLARTLDARAWAPSNDATASAAACVAHARAWGERGAAWTGDLSVIAAADEEGVAFVRAVCHILSSPLRAAEE